MKICNFCFIASTLCVALLLISPAQATQISVSGNVSGVWSADTVLVTGEVRVPPGQSLTILPGVKVLLQGYYKFIVDQSATLTAAGTVTDSIRFDVFTTGTHWHGIRFLAASNSSRLEYCILKHGSATGSGEDYYGGAIYCNSSSPTISHSTLQSNSASFGGGGIYCLNSSPTISANTINSNSALFGGGIFCFTSDPTINGNMISYNLNGVGGAGGGIYCTGSSPTISSNVIYHNYSGTGGGLYLLNPPAAFQFNEISENSASGFGGGIYLDRISITINKNTVAGNTAFEGGGIFCNSSHPTVINSIFWSNTPQQIYPTGGSDPVVNYSDIQGSWTGTGNLNADPLFVNAPQHDYHLQAGSPCIDTGDPNSSYNDPDGTRADMGCYYFDQTANPPTMDINTTPVSPPVVIPANGGSFQYNLNVHNLTTSPQTFSVWNKVRDSANLYTTVFGPVTRTLPGGANPTRILTQTIAGSISSGTLYFISYIGTYPSTIQDSSFFTITKSAVSDGNPWIVESNVTSDFFDEYEDVGVGAHGVRPQQFTLLSATPNPFNPTTSISFTLLQAGLVRLTVFDVAGREVATLVNGMREAGMQNVTFDGSNLASGIYLYKLEAGGFSTVNKMVLMK